MYSIRVVTTLEEFKTLAERWNSLLRQTASDNVFLTWEWLYTWAKHYLGEHHLWILLVYKENSELVGIAPLYIARIKMYGGLNLRDMRFLGTRGVSSSYLDLIVAEKHKKAVCEQFYRHLHGEARSLWDFLTLSEIPCSSSTIDILGGFVQEAGEVLEIAGMTACPVIELSSCLGDFIQGISRNERYNIQRKRKRLKRAGCVSYGRATSVHDVEKEMDTFIQLHQARWEQKGSRGVFGRPHCQKFHRDITRLFGERGWVNLDFLMLDGEAIAGIYGYTYNGRYYFYLPGFNPDSLPQASPGILLLFHRIEEAVREGYREFDLLRGFEDYKMAWASFIRRSLTLRHYNNHFRAALVELLDSGKSVLKTLLR